MRSSSIATAIGVPTLCTAIVLAAFSPALADGINSQWKNRLPQGAPITDTLISGTISVVPSGTSISMQEQEKLAAIVRRNARAASRRAKWDIAETTAPTRASTLTVSQSDVNRARLVIKNYKVAQAKCAPLHTHERATCLYEAQLDAGRSVK